MCSRPNARSFAPLPDDAETTQHQAGPMTASLIGAAMRRRRCGIAVGVAAAILLSAVPSQAQPVADFYRGKTLRMLRSEERRVGKEWRARSTSDRKILDRHGRVR